MVKTPSLSISRLFHTDPVKWSVPEDRQVLLIPSMYATVETIRAFLERSRNSFRSAGGPGSPGPLGVGSWGIGMRDSLGMSGTTHTDVQRVLVTGASRGIGRATAIAFARTGATVVLLARESSELRETAHEVEDLGVRAVVTPCDVRDVTAVNRAIEDVERALGGLDVLVNNAGGGRFAPFSDLTESDWSDVLSLNVEGLVNVTRAVLPVMRRQSRGHVVNIGSIRGLESAPMMTAYTASKFAVTGFTRSLRQELEGSGILVSLISPGGVKTGFGGIGPAQKDPTWMDPAAVADLVVQVAEFRGRGWIAEVTMLPEPTINRG